MLAIRNTDVVVIHHPEHGRRVIFKNSFLNPRDELGKFGVSYSKIPFWGSIPVSVNAIYKGSEPIRRTIRINRKSLKKYVKAMRHLSPEVKASVDGLNDVDLIHLLNTTMLVKDNYPDLSEPQFEAMKRQIEAQYGDLGLRHVGERNQRLLFSRLQAISNQFFSSFYSWLYRKTVSGVNRMRLRFAILHKETNYFKRSEQLALARFKEAAEDVPGYQEFIKGDLPDNQGQEPERAAFGQAFQRKEKTLIFSDIPLTKKSNYITPLSRKAWKTHHHGKYPEQFKVDTSTGTTGNPTVWHRGQDEIKTVKDSMITFGRMRVGGRNVYTIDAFALGPWATGLSVFEMGREMGSIFAPGADAEKILQAIDHQYRYEQKCLKKKVKSILRKIPELDANQFNEEKSALMQFMDSILGITIDNKDVSLKAELKSRWPVFVSEKPMYKGLFNAVYNALRLLDKEKPKIMLTGYPPFLQKFVRYANENNFDFRKYHVQAGIGGQAISESARDNLVNAGFTSVTSSFGASDLDINIGIEEVEIRKVMHQKPEMQRELYGAGKGVPMVFRYDPLNYHIECDRTNNHLIFTSNRDNRSSPRVRYDIQDNGRVYAASDIHAMLAKHGVFMHEGDKHNLPYLFIWGRESTAPWGTTNVPFDVLEAAVHTTLRGKVAKSAFFKFQEGNEDRFEIWVELNTEVNSVVSQENPGNISAELIHEMANINEYFKEELERLNANDTIPRVRFFNPGTSPIAEPDGLRKQVLVFEHGVNCDIQQVNGLRQSGASALVALQKAEYEAALRNPGLAFV